MQRSEGIAELAKALSKFQGELRPAQKDATNPFHKSKYASLESIWESCRQQLAANGLCLVQATDLSDSALALETTLIHTSGEWIASSLALNPVKLDPQGIGSALTYARRYSMSALLGIVADEDDDAEGAMPRGATKEQDGHKGAAPKDKATIEKEAAPKTDTHALDAYLKTKNITRENLQIFAPDKDLDSMASGDIAKLVREYQTPQKELL